MTPTEFVAKWTAESEAMKRRGVMVSGAGLCDELLADFESVMTGQAETVLSLAEAANRSGYSVEHLARLVREGRIPNAGHKGSPRIRAADLPRKPCALVPTSVRTYDPDADARTLLGRQRGGNNG